MSRLRGRTVRAFGVAGSLMLLNVVIIVLILTLLGEIKCLYFRIEIFTVSCYMAQKLMLAVKQTDYLDPLTVRLWITRSYLLRTPPRSEALRHSG